MKTKIIFKGLSDGRIVYRHIQIRHNFSIIPETEFLGYKLPAQSVESQVIDYLDSIDKSDIMLKYNFDIIIDYWVPKKKKKRNEIQEFIEFLKPYITPDQYRPVEAIISEMKDILFGKNKSNEQKAMEVLTVLQISYKAGVGALNIVQKMFNQPKLIENDRQ
jgi:hypothetical protein